MTTQRLVGQQNQCRGCQRFFAKNRTFERHRIGSFGKDRRCMDDEQMTAAFNLGADGFWRGKPKEGSGVAWGAANREDGVLA